MAESKRPNSHSSSQHAPNPGDTPSVSLTLLHTAAQCVVHTIFEQLEAATEDAAHNGGKKDSEDDEDDEESLVLIMSQVQQSRDAHLAQKLLTLVAPQIGYACSEALKSSQNFWS